MKSPVAIGIESGCTISTIAVIYLLDVRHRRRREDTCDAAAQVSTVRRDTARVDVGGRTRLPCSTETPGCGVRYSSHAQTDSHAAAVHAGQNQTTRYFCVFAASQCFFGHCSI